MIRNGSFLKWAGGKRQLVPVLANRFPRKFGTYHEPFVGSGALFFATRPAQAVLSDANARLVRTYIAVRDDGVDVDGVIENLRGCANDPEFFDFMRELSGEIQSRRLEHVTAEADVACGAAFHHVP
jgi:DNA adenine methylase